MPNHSVIISLQKSEALAFIATIQKLKEQVVTDNEGKLLTQVQASLQAQIKHLEYFGF